MILLIDAGGMRSSASLSSSTVAGLDLDDECVLRLRLDPGIFGFVGAGVAAGVSDSGDLWRRWPVARLRRQSIDRCNRPDNLEDSHRLITISAFRPHPSRPRRCISATRCVPRTAAAGARARPPGSRQYWPAEPRRRRLRHPMQQRDCAGSPPAHAVCEITDGGGEIRRFVPLHDGSEIVVYEKCWATLAVRALPTKPRFHGPIRGRRRPCEPRAGSIRQSSALLPVR